jgi:UDP-2,3-diacylglucosamine pyrophosphatase LpxH
MARTYRQKLNELYQKAKDIPIDTSSRMVIFSDLHMGNGKNLDDFKPNADLFTAALADYYIPKGYTLILNGDIEELHRYTLREVRKAWSNLYDLFDQLYREDRLIKLMGNHDSKLFKLPGERLRYKLYESLRLLYRENSLFLFHGHQPSFFYEKFNELSGLLLRFLAKPLRIRNYSVSHSKERSFKIEKRAYDFSREKQIVSIIGHTHRPLFETMSKMDSLNYKIETLLRKHARTEDNEKRIALEGRINQIKAEIDTHLASKGNEHTISSQYSSHTIVPSVFNSGCVIGKRGITAIEIKNGKIYLVHWFHKDIDKRYRRDTENNTRQLGESGFYRSVLKKDTLDYIFTRIRLLT